MFTSRNFFLTIFVLFLLAACDIGPTPQPQPQPQPTNVPLPTVVETPSSVPVTFKPGQMFPEGLTNEPLSVLTTQPADKSEEAPVTKDKARIVVQFNHPVVPLVSVEAQKSLPQPLTIKPEVPGSGEWINTSTYVFTPSRDLTVAATYSVNVSPLKDMLGQALANYTWSFKTASPAIAKTYPEDNTQFVGAAQPITVTFNTEMDRNSVESRFSLKRIVSPTTNEFGPTVSGRIEWQGVVLRFIPDKLLEFDTSYVAQLAAGAQDINHVAATTKNTNWTFRTVKAPDVVSTVPKNGEQSSKDIRQGFLINFSSPMDQSGLKVTIAPTITHQYVYWEYGKSDTAARVSGNWLASQAYVVTISGESRTRYGDKLGKDVVVRFSAAPLDPQLYLNVPGLMGMYDFNGSQTIIATHTNVERIDYKLYKVDRNDFISLIGRDSYQRWQSYRPPEANKLREWSQTPKAPLNASRIISTTLVSSTGARLEPGVYYVAATAPGVRDSARHVLVVSSINVALKRSEREALVWLTDLKSGKPIPNQPLTLLGPTAAPLAAGKSDKDGIFRASFTLPNPYDPVFVVSESEGRVVAAVGSDWNQGINPWDFNMPAAHGAQEFYANLYTDRAIYRPGQTVYFKGILRRDDDAQYSLPIGVESVPIKVRDSQGKEIFSQNVPLNRFGTFNGEIKLSDSAATGYYNLSFELHTKRPFFSSVNFIVAEYRRPEFQVAVQTNKPEYVNGDTIKLDVNSSYFFGGAVSDAAVKWRLLSDDLFFRPAEVKGYWDFIDYDLLTDRRRTGEVVREGKGKTDAAGKFQVEVPADLRDYPLSQNFTLEAEITDINNQAVASRTTVPVHKGRFYIGMKPQRYVGSVGQEQAVDLLTVDTQGKTVAHQALTVSFFERKWYSVREKREDGFFYWKSAYTDTLSAKVDVTTDAQGKALAKFTPSIGGVYRIVGEAQDTSGNKVRSGTYLWVAGAGFINWRIENNDRIDLVADKKQYAPGETAEILIPAPFKDAEALLTVERGTIREVRRLSLPGNSERVQVPIRSDYAPNVYVSVMLVKGRGADSPQPQFKLGYTSLAVSTVEKELKIKVSADKQTHYSPGEKATFTIEASDNAGKAVEAEFSVALVDKAIQSLADDTAQSPLQAFYGQRGLGINTSATLNRSVERTNQQVIAEAKGGGGGLAEQPVRRDFRDTAYWNASVVTDQSGRAQVSIPLPDNLTTWNLTAKGVTAATLVGDARSEIVSTKDLLLRPVTPRFFIAGDKTKIEAVVNNNGDKDITADVRLDAQGLALSGNAQQPLTVRAHDKAKVTWDTTVNAAEQVVVKFSVSGAGLQDAIELPLPVHRQIAAETVATAGQVETKIAEQIQVPAAADKTAGELRIDVSPSLAAASRNSLKYLESFDYECSEQTVSKFFPNIATYAALKKLGIEREDLRRGLETNVSREVQRLYALQNTDGGWGWWRSDESRPYLTAYAWYALSTARQLGFAINPDTMNRAEQFLIRYLEKPVDVKQGHAYNERAFVVFVLTDMGRNYTSRAVNLFEQRTNLDNYGKAYLLMALQRLNQPQAQALQAELTSAAKLSAAGAHWEEAKIDYWTMNSNTRSTATVIMALARTDPKNATLANAVRWLMVARKEGHWETTQVTAWSVLALTEYMLSTGELSGNYTYQVLVNGKPFGDGTVDKSNIDQPKQLSVSIKDLAQSAANELIVSRGAGDGKLYYSAYLNYYLPAENISALNKGIIVGRQYFAVDPQTLKPSDRAIASAKIGDYVQVKLAIVAPTDLHYLVLEDPLPAGFEAVDTTLKTSSVAARGPQLQEKRPETTDEDHFFRPYWSYWAHSDVRDDRVAVFATYLGRGTYEYTYMMRASVAGEFRTLPARAWEMYFPEVFGRSAGATFAVTQ